MNKIKFRAWNSKHKLMYYDRFDVCTFPENEPIFETGLNSNGELFAVYTLIDEVEELELMQYIGIKDINDVEVYEGDIVKFMDCETISTESGIHHEDFLNRGVIKYSEEETRFYVDGLESIDMIYFLDSDYEVIGNIYETPELLEVKI